MDASIDVMGSKSTIYSNFNVVKVIRHHRGGSAISNPQTASENTSFNTDTFFDSLLNLDTLDFHSILHFNSICMTLFDFLKSSQLTIIKL